MGVESPPSRERERENCGVIDILARIIVGFGEMFRACRIVCFVACRFGGV